MLPGLLYGGRQMFTGALALRRCVLRDGRLQSVASPLSQAARNSFRSDHADGSTTRWRSSGG
jgi:hypothetical protein